MFTFIDTEKTLNDPIVFYTQYTLLVLSPILLITLLFKSAGYGRVSENVSSNSTIMVNDKWLWYSHMIETPFAIASIIYYIYNYENYSKTNIILLSMFVAHYFNRGFIYPFFARANNTPRTPIEVALFGILFIVLNSILQSRSILFNSDYPDGYLTSYRFLIGLGVFIIGLRINTHSDYFLLVLKNENKGYVIPQGYLFSYITCPNYFGELIEWFGFYICTQTTASLVFFLFSFANLVPKALDNYKWYINKFGNEFPKERKILLDFENYSST